jgi:hypothetical protein
MSNDHGQDGPRIPYADLIPSQETPEDIRARLYRWHANAGTIGVFYSMYPDECPPGYFERLNGFERERER